MLLRLTLRYSHASIQFRDLAAHHLIQNMSADNYYHPLLRQLHAPFGRGNIVRSIRNNNRHRNAIHSKLQPLELPPTPGGDSIPFGNIIKAFIFTGAFSLGSFFGATILEYENTRNMMLEKARQAKLSWLFRKTNKQTYWSNLKANLKRSWEKLTPGDKVFLPICTFNVLVFFAWRIPVFKATMLKYFCSNPASHAICWPMFLSTFSHYSGLHLFANMYVLHSFSSAIVASLGKEQFLGLYLSAGVISSLSSILYKSFIGQAGLSLGASGAIMAILAYVCAQYPDTQLSILFLPMFTFSAGTALKVIMGVDLAGCILGWRFFDHAAHFGGALFGLFWAYYGMDVWQKRLAFLAKYHDWRKAK